MTLEIGSERTAGARRFLFTVAPVFGLSLIISVGVLYLLVIGSGILPINLSRLLLTAVPIAAIVALLCYGFRRRQGVLGVVLILGSVLGSATVFRYCVDSGFEKAKTYGALLAGEIQALHDKSGTWPVDLNQIPIERRPFVAPEWLGSYRYSEENRIYSNIGGFYIDYQANNQIPELKVERRDYGVTWNWTNSRWD